MPSLQHSIDMDLNLIAFHTKELRRFEQLIYKELKKHQLTNLYLVKTVIGIGDLLVSLILLEIGDLDRLPRAIDPTSNWTVLTILLPINILTPRL
ncbi:hypothetical protein NBRC116583_34310 [Arenicella sp. 4NH20-0111]|uniref:hypothetical protein n=1 Tax=Arenicella sp. 4NH20-0111 TaxID=3127648 RepID=UPI003104FF0C